MTTTGERLVSISTLLTGTAMDHFLNISTGAGGTVFVDGILCALESDAAVELEPDYVVVIEEEPEAEMDEEIYLE
jgi:hypothetical protein